MKFSTLLVAGSLMLNATIAVMYFSRSSSVQTAWPAADTTSAAPDTNTPRGNSISKTKTTPAKGTDESPTWAALNTGDLRSLAARLKAAGFPPALVRSIVATQLSESFRARRLQLLPTIEDRPFWKTDSSGRSSLLTMDPKYRTASRELSREQTQLLKEIIGSDTTTASAEQDEYLVRRFGNLPKDKIEQLQRLDQDYNDLRSELTLAARGLPLPEDREKLAILEREKRVDLAQLLTPEEAEEYLMRTSQTTTRLRQTLTAFNATEDEFKALYRVQAAYDEKYSTALGGAAAIDRNERLAAQAQTEELFKAALGEGRYAEFARAADREYQQLTTMTKQAGVPEAAAIAVVDLRESLLKESNRIYDDTSLNQEQKRAAIQALAQTARTDALSTLGTDVGQKYLQVAERWLSGLERGAAVKLTYNTNGGSSMSMRNIPPPRPARNQGAVQQAPVAPR